MEKVNQLVSLVEELKIPADKFYNKGNQSAGLALRKLLQEVKRLSQSIRVEVSELKKAKKAAKSKA